LKKTEHAIILLILATGVSSVVTQLLTIREFLAQFSGNEFIITLIFFNWLVLSGTGTLFARRTAILKKHMPSACTLTVCSLTLACLPVLQFFFIRFFRDFFFTHGTSVGFYPTLMFSMLLMAPYCLTLGFVLPYSLFILRLGRKTFSGTSIYIIDNIGDISGGILFSFVLIFVATPMQAFLFCGTVLIVATIYFCHAWSLSKPFWIISGILSFTVLLSGIFLEWTSIAPLEGMLETYKESRYGRVAVHKNKDQYTFFLDGMPVVSSQNELLAEEIVHFPLSQIERAENILVISGQGGIMREIARYKPENVFYLEMDPDVSGNMFRYGMITPIPGLQVIHEDAGKWLAATPLTFNAVIMNMPEPDTFQVNRFYTDRFFREVSSHLHEDGIFSFYIDGYDNYMTEPQREKISTIYNTLSECFSYISVLPAEKIFFLGSRKPIDTDIPKCLEKKGIDTEYIKSYFYGNITSMRMNYLSGLIDEKAPVNSDLSPRLMRIMYRQWFEKFDSSPIIFVILLTVSVGYYILRLSKGEYVLFTTGIMAMGSEIIIIFIYQTFYGYIYFKIGIIITLFLSGLLPGAIYGERFQTEREKDVLLAVTDGLIILMMVVLVAAISFLGAHVHHAFFLACGFIFSILCGFQFPLASRMKNNNNETLAAAFSADLMGASLGTILTSLILIPWSGIYGAIVCLLLIKLTSIAITARSS